MDPSSPYQPPRAAGPPPLAPGAAEPVAIKVFGILHLVCAGIGVLMGIWSVVSVFFSSRMIGFGMPSGGDTERFVAAQRAYMDEVAWVSVLTGGFMLLLAAMLVVAGVGLLKRRASGLAWSNRYAWTSIGTKLVSLVVTVWVVVPASSRMIDGMLEGLPARSESVMGIMRTVTAIGGVLGTVVAMAYPVLALVLLNREPVKRFLAEGKAAG